MEVVNQGQGNNNPQQVPIEYGRGLRVKERPKYMRIYETKYVGITDHSQPPPDSGTSTIYPLSHFVFYERFSHSHKAFLAAITSNDEPNFFSEAVKHPEWREAMIKEVQALETNDTWTLEHLPPGKKAVDSKWVYKIKYKPNGDIERYKA